MKKIFFAGLLAFLLLGMLAAALQVKPGEQGKMAAPMRRGNAHVELRLAMRKLWEDHITWTRMYIVSALAGLEDVDKVAERLLQNQEDLGNAVKPYYGEEAGTKLTKLLKEHIMIATEVVKAAQGGKAAELTKAQAKWAANGDEIAAFLSGANPHWPKPVLADMLRKHLEYTTAEVVCRLKKDWGGDIAAYDKGHVHMLMFADALTKGIIKQFPEKFAK
jgi:hypothetical protein